MVVEVEVQLFGEPGPRQRVVVVVVIDVVVVVVVLVVVVVVVVVSNTSAQQCVEARTLVSRTQIGSFEALMGQSDPVRQNGHVS